jgi:hypothetical protein
MELINKIVAFFQSAHLDAWVVFLLMVTEYWLGKTELVKPASTVEVALLAFKKVLDFVKGILGFKVG